MESGRRAKKKLQTWFGNLKILEMGIKEIGTEKVRRDVRLVSYSLP